MAREPSVPVLFEFGPGRPRFIDIVDFARACEGRDSRYLLLFLGPDSSSFDFFHVILNLKIDSEKNKNKCRL